MYPTVNVWQGGQLVSPSALPQFNGTTGANTVSLQITNNSDVTLVFALEKATPVTILPRYRLTAPCIPNSQYNLSMAAGSASSADTQQYVTLTESINQVAFSLEPLNTDVTIVGGTVTISGTANVNVANTPAVTLSGATNDVNVINTASVNVANTPAVTLTGAGNNVNIANTPNVNVTGTPNVNIANTPTVSVGGTVTATISSGSVNVGTIAGNVDIVPGIFSLSGNSVKKVAVSGTAVQLHTTVTTKVVMVKARSSNVGTIYIGTSTVTAGETATGGMQMDPGDIVVFTATDLATVYINGTAGDGVTYLWWV